MRADAAPAQPAANDRLVPPGGGYRRLENQLYRVEIHEAGARWTATYKWSRDNGSILTKGVKVDATTPAAPVITVSDPGKDAVLGFAAAAWVEISDEERTLRNEPGVLLEVTAVKGGQNYAEAPGQFGAGNGHPADRTALGWHRNGPDRHTRGAQVGGAGRWRHGGV
ncbi:MAG: hypothetical protein IPM84_20345 [Anaerolineae bacterium]|nr:hypothetical protein [Anaerolineae bacterium]